MLSLNSMYSTLSSAIEFLNSPVNMTTNVCTQIDSRLLPQLRYCSTETVQIATEGHILLLGVGIGFCSRLLIVNAYQALRNRCKGVPAVQQHVQTEAEPSQEQVALEEQAAFEKAVEQVTLDQDVAEPKDQQPVADLAQEKPDDQKPAVAAAIQAPEKSEQEQAAAELEPAQKQASESLFTCFRGLSKFSIR